jgi:hypothetical protein
MLDRLRLHRCSASALLLPTPAQIPADRGAGRPAHARADDRSVLAPDFLADGSARAAANRAADNRAGAALSCGRGGSADCTPGGAAHDRAGLAPQRLAYRCTAGAAEPAADGCFRSAIACAGGRNRQGEGYSGYYLFCRAAHRGQCLWRKII